MNFGSLELMGWAKLLVASTLVARGQPDTGYNYSYSIIFER